MKTLVLGGFLGSGKTTVLLQLARYIVHTSKSTSQYKLIILENEIGQAGVDDKLFRANQLTVENLFSGCACCSMSGQLVDTVLAIQEQFDPDWLILEATGVAYPKNIRDNFQTHLSIPTRICTLADASRWERLLLPMKNVITQQLEGADVILLNKCDLVSPEKRMAAEKSIRSFNEDAVFYPISAAEPIDEKIWKEILGGDLL